MASPTPGAGAVLQIWERGRREHPIDRALTVLSVLTGRARRELAELPLDTRDQLLLERRATLFGAVLTAVARCRSCGCAVDVSVQPQPHDVVPESFTVDGVVVRLPTSVDLAEIAASVDVPTARQRLLARLIESGEPGPDALAAVEAELDRRAGLSGSALELTCPDCDAEWGIELDVAAFVWREIEILAARLLRDVDALARRYGWSENDILALSSDRRRFYLELAS